MDKAEQIAIATIAAVLAGLLLAWILGRNNNSSSEPQGVAASSPTVTESPSSVTVIQSSPLNAQLQIGRVSFEAGSTTLDRDGRGEVEKIVSYLEDNSEVSIEIAGFTDTLGNEEDNIRLSQERATAVKSYIVEAGISPKRLVAVGYGEAQPLVYPDDTPQAQEQNRRIEFRVLP